MIHSAEGSAAGLQSVVDGPREASWHFEVHKDGKIIQRVDTANIAWTNGSFESNKKFWGIENEGVTGEALTKPQFEALAKLVKWLLGPLPHVRGQTLHEHNEMTAYGSLPTSCPNGRIPWRSLIAAMEDDMTPEEVRAIVIDTILNADFAWGEGAKLSIIGRDGCDLFNIGFGDRLFTFFKVSNDPIRGFVHPAL